MTMLYDHVQLFERLSTSGEGWTHTATSKEQLNKIIDDLATTILNATNSPSFKNDLQEWRYVLTVRRVWATDGHHTSLSFRRWYGTINSIYTILYHMQDDLIFP